MEKNEGGEVSFLAQKSKVTYAKVGDENSKLFHGMLKQKRRKIVVHGILKDGDWISDPILSKKRIFKFFRINLKK